MKDLYFAQDVQSVWIQSTSEKLDGDFRQLPPSLAHPIKIPSNILSNRQNVQQFIGRAAAKMALTGSSLVLVLLSASESAAQDAPTDVSTIEGVTGFEVQADGSALVSLENGTTVRLAPGSFELAGDSLLVAASIADQIAANAALAAAGGAGGAAIGGLAALAGLAGAGGGGGGDEPLIGGGSGGGGSTTLTPGSVVDGYIVGASVFQDVNGNGIFDTGEPNTVTDANGDFEIELANETAKLISIGGTDSSTGQAFTGTLTAPAGSSVVTPLTTLVQSYAEANGIDASTASDNIAAALGLDGDTNLLDLDPVAEAASGTPEGLAAFAVAAQVASVISAAAAAVGEDGASEASAAVAASLASALVDDEGESPKDNLTSGDAITAALQAAGVEEDQVSSIEAAVTAANGIIASGDSVQAIEAVQEVVQGSLVEAIGQSSEEGPVDIPDATAIEEAVSLVVPLRPVLNDPNEAFGIFGPTELGSASLEISGTGRPDSWVKVSVVDADGQEVTSDAVQVDAQGDWALVLDSAELPSASGEYGIKVGGSLDETGPFTVPVSDEETAGTITIDVTGPDAPTIDDLTADADNRLELDERNSDFEVSGTTEANASVTVTINGEEESSQADGDGEFRVTFDSFSTDTNFTVSVVATDTLGNVGTAETRDVEVEPESDLIPTVNAVSEAFGGPDLANGLVVTGTGRDGSTVSVTIGGITKEATFGEGDTWSVTFEQGDLPDADGDYAVEAVATLGIFTSVPVAGGTLSVDVTGPDAPAITGVIADGALGLDERGTELEVSGTAEANAAVTVTIGDSSQETNADGDGNFTVTFDSPDADFTVDVVATDTLGNVGDGATIRVEVEPESALIPTINPIPGKLNLEGIAAGLEVTGRGRAGSAVEVTIDGDAQTTTVGTDGTWSVTFEADDLPTADGDYDVTAVATFAGFTGEAEDGVTLSIDQTAPGGGDGGDQPQVIEGTESDDTLNGNDLGNDIYGFAGDDELNGAGGADDLSGGDGNDTLNGGDGADWMIGGAGDDVLNGGDGNDYLFGDEEGYSLSQDEAGNNTLDGGNGNDVLVGGASDDTMTGGAGIDLFVIGHGGDDVIEDFEGLQIDRLEFDYSSFGLTEEDVEATLGTAATVNGNAVISLPNGAGSITFEGWTVEALQAEVAQYDVEGLDIDSPDENGVYEGDAESDDIFVSGDGGVVKGTWGNDYIDLYGLAPEGFVLLDYNTDAIVNPIDVEIGFDYGYADVFKASLGRDEVYFDPYGFSFPNIGFVDTEGDDGFDVIFGSNYAELNISFVGGNDFVEVQKGTDGTLNLDVSETGTVVTADLNAGEISYDNGNSSVRVETYSYDVPYFEEYDYFDEGDFIANEYLELSLQTGSGADAVTGSDEDDNLLLGAGNDVADGGDGNDDIFGEAGEDVLNGGRGSDDLDGGDDNDVLTGGAGNDDLDGGAGDDVLNGGDGYDFFVIGEGHDVIEDLIIGEDAVEFTGAWDDAEDDDVTFEELQYGGLDALKVVLDDANSITLVGYTEADVDSLFAAFDTFAFPLTEWNVGDPVFLTLNQPTNILVPLYDGDFGASGDDLTSAVSVNADGTEISIAVSYDIDGAMGSNEPVDYVYKIIGTDLAFEIVDASDGGEDLALIGDGIVTSFEQTAGGETLAAVTNINASGADFLELLDTAFNDDDPGIVNAAGTAFGDSGRPVVIEGTDDTSKSNVFYDDVIAFDGASTWVFTGEGNDLVFAGQYHDGFNIISVEGGNDEIVISDDAADTAVIVSDTSGVPFLEGFRAGTNDDTRDFLVVETESAIDLNTWIGVGNDVDLYNATDQDIADIFNATFDDVADDGEIAGLMIVNEFGDGYLATLDIADAGDGTTDGGNVQILAVLGNAEVPQIYGGNSYDDFMRYVSDAPVGPSSELV